MRTGGYSEMKMKGLLERMGMQDIAVVDERSLYFK